MSVQIKSNNAYGGSSTLTPAAQIARSAADLYSIYSARVTADGGTVADATACQAAITAALARGYFYQAAWAISARWGLKTSAGNVTKLYSIIDASGDCTVTGTLPLDATPGWNTVLFSSSGSLNFSGVTVNKAGKMGYVGSSSVAVAGVGPYLSFTPVSQLWTYNDRAGQMTVNGVNQTNGLSSSYSVASNDSIGIFVDQTTSPNPTFQTWANGREKSSQSQSITTLANSATANMSMQRAGASNSNLNESWYFSAATYDAIANCTFDVGNRY